MLPAVVPASRWRRWSTTVAIEAELGWDGTSGLDEVDQRQRIDRREEAGERNNGPRSNEPMSQTAWPSLFPSTGRGCPR
jgi:hypothetical protein